jgi:hypothetical protein
MGAFPGGGAMGVGAIPVGGGMAIPIAVGTGPPPPGAIVGQTAGGFGAFMNAMGLVGLGPLPGVAAHGHHHPPPFTAGAAAAAAATPAAPAAANGGTANNGAAPAAPAVTPTFDDGGFGVDFDDDGGAPVDEMD